MDSVMIASREVPEGLEDMLKECGFKTLVHVPDTTRTIAWIKSNTAKLAIISTTCPGAEPHFAAVHAASHQKQCQHVIVAINNRHVNLAAERTFYQSMGVAEVVALPKIVHELPEILQGLTEQRDAS